MTRPGTAGFRAAARAATARSGGARDDNSSEADDHGD